jgi:predicted aspartyl protease
MKIQIPINFILVALLVILMQGCELRHLFQRKKIERLMTTNTYHKFEYKRHIIIPATFPSQEVKNMALDLGAGSSILIRNTGLEFIKPLEPVLSFGITRSADNKLIKNKYYSVGNIATEAFKLENAFLSIIDNFQVSPCNNFVGIWGADTFDEKIMIIRMQDSTLAVLDSLPSLDGWTLVDAKYRYPHYFVDVNIGGKKVKFLFDTGCTGGIVMNQSDYNKTFSNSNLLLSDERKFYGNNFVTGTGVVADTSIDAELENLRIGDFRLSPVSITLSERIHSKVIGLELMRQFNILLDFKQGRLYLQTNPNYHYKKSLNAFYRMGLSFYVLADGDIVINSLQLNSAAEKAGLKIGDRILSINDIKTKNGENCKIIQQLREIEMTDMHMEIIVRRGNETLTFLL